MNENEIISFNKKEIEIIMSYCNNYIEFVMLANLEDNKDWTFENEFNSAEQFDFLNKIRKMCSI